MTKKPNEIKGLLIPSNKTFYYLETGPVTINNPLDRVSKVLMSRDLIRANDGPPDPMTERPIPMTLLEATEKGYTVEVLYVSNHVKSSSKDSKPLTKKIGWK